jgi:hypothetical protein
VPWATFQRYSLRSATSTQPGVKWDAFRVLEDIGFSFGIKNDKPDWNAMNSALGTSKNKWAQLTEAGTMARHLSDQGLRKLEMMDRAALIGLAHEAVTLCLTKKGILGN